ncbi:hypothetical protein BDW67DRAFT_168579 [Aspergillus spinulosporus]
MTRIATGHYTLVYNNSRVPCPISRIQRRWERPAVALSVAACKPRAEVYRARSRTHGPCTAGICRLSVYTEPGRPAVELCKE